MADSKISAIQSSLNNKGFSPGEVDGIWGRRTISAVKEFQQSEGLTVDGVVGPNTAEALFETHEDVASLVALPWMTEAQNLLGTKENLGPLDNPLILDWAKNLDIHYKGDDVPWCGLFVAHCIGSSLLNEPLPSNPLGARRWRSFGAKTEPKIGAVMVFWRGSKSGVDGHVGFYTGEDKTSYRILGGNQSDQVCFAWIEKDRLIDARWPTSATSLDVGSAIVVMDKAKDIAKSGVSLT